MKKQRPIDSPRPAWALGLTIEWHEVIEELKHESDRGVALMGAAYLDAALEALLHKSLGGNKKVIEKLVSQPNAPLGTFSSRIAMAYALGHIGPNYYQTLEAIREVRNAFAHLRRRLTFEDSQVRKLITSGFKLPYVLPSPPPDLSRMRNRFIWTTAGALGFLTHATLHAKTPVSPSGG